MRILSIRFQNLNSLHGGHELNLESGPLAEAGLFAITGPTGAGKSTILDAVTLALYARAARYGKDTAEDMMSRGAAECSAAVEFTCASGRYTAKWLLRRARGRAEGNLQPLKHELSQDGVIIEDKTRGVLQKVEELTGLDYDRFLRSVLLAQGQFAAFLRAGKDDRADLLERITGSHIYSELGALAYQISAGHAREIALENIRLGAVTLLPEDERAAISARLAAMEEDLAADEDRRAVLAAKVAAAKRGTELRRQTEEHTTAVARHAAGMTAFAPEEARLKLHAATLPCSEPLSALSESERTAQRAAAVEADAVRKADTARETAAHAAGTALAALAADEAATEAERHEIADKRKKTAEELSAAGQWLSEHQTDASLAEQLPDLSAAVQRVTSLAAQRAALEKKCQAARGAAERAVEEAKLAAARSYAAQQLAGKAGGEAAAAKAALAALLTEPWTSRERLEREVQRLANVASAVQRMQGAHSDLTAQQTKLAVLDAEIRSLEARVEKLAAANNTAREKVEAAHQKGALLQELARQEQLIRSMEEHRAHLEQGKPCPLCGAAEHPWADPSGKPADDSAEERLKLHGKEQLALEKSARDTAAAAAEADKLLAAARGQQQSMRETLAGSQGTLEQEWRDHFPDTECNAESLAAAGTKMAADHAALSALAARVRGAQETEQAAVTAAERAAGEAKVLLTRAEAAEKHAAAAANTVTETEESLRGIAADFVDEEQRLRTAFCAAGEADASDPAAALLRVKSRELAWRGAVEARAGLEKQAVLLQHDREKCAQHAKIVAGRRAETEAAIERAGLTPARATAPEGGWNAVSAAFAKAITDSQATKSLAGSTHKSAQQAAEQAAELHRSLTAALTGSAFADIAALRAAQLDAAVLQTLTSQREALRGMHVRLETQKEGLAREEAALQAEWQRLGGLPADTESEFDEALAALTKQVNVRLTERGALQQQIDTDDAARTCQAAAAAELEKQKSAAAPWARLAELIGSADGDKFSRYAQSITLDHLTALANQRLAQLCDRYRLQRCGAASELALQIEDGWQAGTVRPMESLSGGETFLISLALALGLSELAGRRTRIGTLFIDEGFGTLDSTALDIALSALEGLRAGHSTIGIISHVEALKARLTTQVEVVRSAGGWSRLELRT